MVTFIDRIGNSILQQILFFLEICVMGYVSLRSTLFGRNQGWRTLYGVISAQIYFTGYQALPLISMLAMACGALVAFQSTMQVSLLGDVDLVGNFMITVIVREIGPLLTALFVIARSGTAVASELGAMRVNKEIESLQSMGINPMSFIVFPRLIGGIISVLCLAFYFTLFALLGGFILCHFVQNIPFEVYVNSLARAFSFGDLWIFLFKNTFSGSCIFLISCYQGLKVKNSLHEIPQVTTQAVVKSIIYVLAFNMIVSFMFYLHKFKEMGLI